MPLKLSFAHFIITGGMFYIGCGDHTTFWNEFFGFSNQYSIHLYLITRLKISGNEFMLCGHASRQFILTAIIYNRLSFFKISQGYQHIIPGMDFSYFMIHYSDSFLIVYFQQPFWLRF